MNILSAMFKSDFQWHVTPGPNWASSRHVKQSCHSCSHRLLLFSAFILSLSGRFHSCREIPYIWIRGVLSPKIDSRLQCLFLQCWQQQQCAQAYESLHSSALHRGINLTSATSQNSKNNFQWRSPSNNSSAQISIFTNVLWKHRLVFFYHYCYC